MTEIDATIGSVGDLVRIVETGHTGSFRYRGQPCGHEPLLPTLTRKGSPGANGLDHVKGETVRDKEEHILREFRTRLAAYRTTAPNDDLNLSIIAQHHGAPTRLLDWTMNPLAALFFAVEDADRWNRERRCPTCEAQDCTACKEQDCAPHIWAVAGDRLRISDFPATSFDELDDRPYFVIPDNDEQRSAVQQSLVCVWRTPTKPFDQHSSLGDLWRLRVERRYAADLLWILNCLGINRETLFPDVDGLGRYLSWKHRRIHEREYRAAKPG